MTTATTPAKTVGGVLHHRRARITIGVLLRKADSTAQAAAAAEADRRAIVL